LAPDMELVGLVERSDRVNQVKDLVSCPVVDSVEKLTTPHGVALCIPSTLISKVAPDYLSQGIATVDGFDVHGQPMLDLLEKLDGAARAGEVASVSGSGWDPGTDSMVRALFQIIAPQGITHTNFGPGMSMGHTVAVKAVDGVKEALAITIPQGQGQHRRQIYIELEPGAIYQDVKKKILTDNYFRHDKTKIIQVEDVAALQDMGHGVHIQRLGVASGVHNQVMDYKFRVTNPAVTAQVMVAGLRGALRQKPGSYVMMGLSPLDMLPGPREKLIKELC